MGAKLVHHATTTQWEQQWYSIPESAHPVYLHSISLRLAVQIAPSSPPQRQASTSCPLPSCAVSLSMHPPVPCQPRSAPPA